MQLQNAYKWILDFKMADKIFTKKWVNSHEGLENSNSRVVFQGFVRFSMKFPCSIIITS